MKVAWWKVGLCVLGFAFAARGASAEVSVNGTLANTGGVPVPVNATDGDTINVTVYTDSLGFYNLTVDPDYPDGSLHVWFVDCNNMSHDTVIQFFPGLLPVTYNGDYCAPVGTDSCWAHYDVSYDSAARTFNVVIDSVTQENAVTYLWTFGDGTFSNLPFPTHVYPANGLYSVCVNITEADSQVCQYCHTLGIDSSGNPVMRTEDEGFTVNVVAFGSASTKALRDVSHVDVYPNPTTGIATLRFAASHTAQYDLTVHNTSGKEVIRQRLSAKAGNNNVPISLEDLSQGIYVVALSTADGEVLSRVVIKK